METMMGFRKERAAGTAVQRSGDAAMLILPWTKQILCVVWDHLRFLVHIIYYSFLAVFQMFRLEVHLRITDETGHHVQHMSASDQPAESFILSSLFDGTNMLSKCGVDTYAGGSHAALLSGLRPEDLCCSLVDDFVMRATECFSESDEDLRLGQHSSWQPSNSADWDIHVAEDFNGTADMCCDYNTPVEVLEAAPKSECTKDLEESSWDDDEGNDDESNLEQNQAMWQSFTKSNDPYNPLSFSACMSTCSKKDSTPETAESSKGKNPDSCSTLKEETLTNKSQKTYQDTGHVSSESESGWDSSCDSSAEEDEENQKIWDSFSHPEDPYNPLHFTACASSSRRASGGVSHGEETPSVLGHEDDVQSDELARDDHTGGSQSDESRCSEEDELWNSFSQGDDPYHPLHFRACLRSSPPAQGMANPGPQLTGKTTQPQGLRGGYRSKPCLPNRHFKHWCSQRSWNSQKTVPWMKGRLGSGIPAEPQKMDKPQIKKVRFSPIVHVHVMRAWSSALQASRKGPWEEMARDRDRFQRRIVEAEQAIGYCLSPSHREKILARIWDT